MDMHLVLLYLSLLKQENYKEQVDSTSFYKLLGLESNATKEEIETMYRLIKEKMDPKKYPEFSVYAERFEYLLGRIDRGYNDFVSGKVVLEDEIETLDYVPISEMENDYKPEPFVPYTPKASPEFISQMQPEEFQPDLYIPYTPKTSSEFISQMQPEEFQPDPYIPYTEKVSTGFISEGNASRPPHNSALKAYASDEIFKAGDDIKCRNISIPIEEVDELSMQILDVVIGKILEKIPLRGPEMIESISDILKNYDGKRFDSHKK